MSYFILERLLYYSTHVLSFLEHATIHYIHGSCMGEWAKIFFFSSLIHNSIIRGQYELFLKTCKYSFDFNWQYVLFSLVLLLPKIFYIIWLSIWAYFMKVIPETCRALWIRYIRIYLKHTAILYVLELMLSYKLTLHLFYIFSQICSKETFAYHNPFNNFFNDFTRVSFEMANLVNNVSI